MQLLQVCCLMKSPLLFFSLFVFIAFSPLSFFPAGHLCTEQLLVFSTYLYMPASATPQIKDKISQCLQDYHPDQILPFHPVSVNGNDYLGMASLTFRSAEQAGFLSTDRTGFSCFSWQRENRSHSLIQKVS